MSELRYNPFLDTYTIVAANRQNRPHLPKDFCPFCPDSGKVPESYEAMIYPNDFPALTQNPDPVNTEHFFQKKQAYGACEVILYSSEHHLRMSGMTVSQIEKIVNLWVERHKFYSKDDKIQYIFPFENNGEETGVTIHHPHGQLYAYSWVPQKIEIELQNSQKYFLENQSNLLLDLVKNELKDGTRVIDENQDFVTFIPFFTDFPYGVYIAPKLQLPDLSCFTQKNISNLAQSLQKITIAFDKLFGKPFPYMMCIHQCPVNSIIYSDSGKYYGFHIEFYPPLREANKIKWYASSEMGAWAATNTRNVEETAMQLKQLIQINL